MSEHTPTPWQRNGHYIETVSTPPGKHCQLTICDLLGEREVAAAEGDFIIRAVNSHEALVKALHEYQRVAAAFNEALLHDCAVEILATLDSLFDQAAAYAAAALAAAEEVPDA